MDYEINVAPDHIRATLYGRETLDETRAFMRAVLRANEEHARSAVLLDIHQSRTIFSSGPRGLLEGLRKIASNGRVRIALLGDTAELRLSHEYLALLARQQGLSVQSLPFEAAAARWLRNRRLGQDRRLGTERRGRVAQRSRAEPRRRRTRRYASQKGASSHAPGP